MKFTPLAISLLMEATNQSHLVSYSLVSVSFGVAHAQLSPLAVVPTTNLRGGGGGQNGNDMHEFLGQGLSGDSVPNRGQAQETLLSDWALCSTSDQCLTGCCTSWYSRDGRLKCTPLDGAFRPDICVTQGGDPELASYTTLSTGTCGGGSRGNGICADGTCCSTYGWCGVTPEHCSGGGGGGTTGGGSGAGTCGGGNRGNGICADGTCCSTYGWCGVTPEHCAAGSGGGGTTGGGSGTGTCGGGNRGNGICADGTCCSEYGWCGVTPEHCATGSGGGGTTGGGSGTCGDGNRGNGICADGTCCSEFGWCGVTPEHCAASGGGGGSVTSPPGTGTITSPSITLTTQQVQVGINTKGDNISVSPQIVDTINRVTKGYFLYQQIAFVAHTIWESGSYQFKEELDTSNYENYQDCDWNQDGIQFPTNGKLFYGRGYLQLSWCANYKAYGASRMYQGDPDLFYNQPELVATDEFYAMDSAAWFFETIVTDTSGQFGLTTNAINGPLECSGGSSDKARKRYEIFVAIANAVGLTGYSESGCYN